jgi:hypothetical protein
MITLLLLLVVTPAWAEPLPVPKQPGQQCPGGYARVRIGARRCRAPRAMPS